MKSLPPIKNAMLMAAGLGTRLKPFTDLVPKPMLPLMGVPMAQFAVDMLAQAQVENIVANIHHLPELSKEGFKSLELPQSCKIQISDESQLLLGSAGGAKKALPLLGAGPFYWVNADVLCEVDLEELKKRHFELKEKFGVHLTITVFPEGPEPGAYREILYNDQGLVTGLTEPVKKRPFFASVAIVEPEALAGVPSGPAEFVPTIFLPAILAQKAGVYLASGAWSDVGSPALWYETHIKLMDQIEKGQCPKLWQTRIEKQSHRLASSIWASKNVKGPVTWSAPAYWSPLSSGYTAQAGQVKPEKLGPGAILYGDLLSGAGKSSALKSGIGLGKKWVDL